MKIQIDILASQLDQEVVPENGKLRIGEDWQRDLASREENV